jgi:hypothetical protein
LRQNNDNIFIVVAAFILLLAPGNFSFDSLSFYLAAVASI